MRDFAMDAGDKSARDRRLDGLLAELRRVEPYQLRGEISACQGARLICHGLHRHLSIGDLCTVERPARGGGREGRDADAGGHLLAEVMALTDKGAVLMPFEELDGVGLGATVRLSSDGAVVRPGPGWLGRVVDPLGRPLDRGPPIEDGPVDYPVQTRALAAHLRRGLGERLDLGVRALNLFAPCRQGQRLGIFAGTGVGKTTLLSMLAQHSGADALVLGLIGERGRELHDFLNSGLGPAARERSVIVVATSDMPAMQRRRAAQTTMAVAEALRDQGLTVLCLIDSVTRYAMALREIYLAAGEPPTSKGYPPRVFAELPRLLERAGPGACKGSITGLFTVLVEGDDLNDPIADAVRGILDGHVVLDRRIAEQGRFPAIDVLKSLSRTAPGCYAPEERPLVEEARQLLRVYEDVAELIQLGAYKPGTDPLTDRAIEMRPKLEALLKQDEGEQSRISEDFARLTELLQVTPD
ncbi:MAG: FliI/YscN family ATPase [Alphaproteobacteria bacterium]|nr:FliI/YscN family ATPase [Alphaproteobacteria bacterium]